MNIPTQANIAGSGLNLNFYTSREDVDECRRKEVGFREDTLKGEKGNMVHHFNWEGRPVCTRSNTPPEHSLFVLMCLPRVVPRGASNELWHKIIMRCAMVYVDPVVIYNEGADIPKSPRMLLRYAKNRTVKFYTRHGSWYQSKKERKDILDDEGDVEFYMDRDLGVGNGFVECSAVKSRHQRFKEEEALQSLADKRKRKKHNLPKRIEDLRRPCRPSRLRYCTAADEL